MCVFVGVDRREGGRKGKGRQRETQETNMVRENAHIQQKSDVKLKTDKGW